MNLALAYLRLGDRDGAARERESVRRLDPSAVHQLDQFFSAAGMGVPPRTTPHRR